MYEGYIQLKPYFQLIFIDLPASKGLQYSSCKCHTIGATQSGYGHYYQDAV